MASGNVVWKVLAAGTGPGRGAKAIGKALDRTWARTRGGEPPRNPADPQVEWREAVLWALASGAAVGLARLVAARGSAGAWRRLTGGAAAGRAGGRRLSGVDVPVRVPHARVGLDALLASRLQHRRLPGCCRSAGRPCVFDAGGRDRLDGAGGRRRAGTVRRGRHRAAARTRPPRSAGRRPCSRPWWPRGLGRAGLPRRSAADPRRPRSRPAARRAVRRAGAPTGSPAAGWSRSPACAPSTSRPATRRRPPVVLLHGLGATNASMLPTLWDLAVDHRVLAPDLPGHGAIARPSRVLLPRLVRRLAGPVPAGRGRGPGGPGGQLPRRAGRAGGGAVAARGRHRAGAAVPVTGVPAAAPARAAGAAGAPRARGRAAPRPTHAMVVEAIRAMFSDPDRLAAVLVRLRRGRVPARVPLAAATGRRSSPVLRQIYVEQAHGEHGFWTRLPTCHGAGPVRVGRAGPARARRVRPARRARRCPTARSVVLADCGHVPQFEQPERTHALVRELLRRGPRRPRRLSPRSASAGRVSRTPCRSRRPFFSP